MSCERAVRAPKGSTASGAGDLNINLNKAL